VRLVPSGWRYERKFTTENLQRYELESLIRQHPACFRPLYSPRWINNIYCETPGLANYRAHVAGSSRRTKLRLRWYGEPFGEHQPILELKRRDGQLGSKESLALPKLTVTPELTTQFFREWVMSRSGLEGELREALLSRDELLLNRYHRQYFETPDRAFRLTLDHQLSFARPRRRSGRMQRVRPTTQLLILELKYDREVERDVATIASAFPMRLGRMSKFISGVEFLEGL